MAASSPEDVLVALLNCLCAEFATSMSPPGNCCITAGNPVIATCCDGFLWVRLISAWPSTKFPGQDSTTGRCVTSQWAMQAEIGLARCAPADCNGTGNSCCAAELDSTLLLLEDFNKFRKVLNCCLAPALNTTIDDIIPGRWVVNAPSGGCISTTQTVTVRWVDDCICA